MHSFLRSLSVVATSLAIVGAAPTVELPSGTLIGTTCPNGANAFISVPFAVPPVGELRWTSPQAYNQSFPGGTRNATTPGNICIQFGGNEFSDPGPEAEDWYFPHITHIL
jgi:carboxylesterase type B